MIENSADATKNAPQIDLSVHTDPYLEFRLGTPYRVPLLPETCDNKITKSSTKCAVSVNERISVAGEQSFSTEEGQKLRLGICESIVKTLSPQDADEYRKEEAALQKWNQRQTDFWKNQNGRPAMIYFGPRPQAEVYDKVNFATGDKEKEIVATVLGMMSPEEKTALSRDLSDFEWKSRIQEKMEEGLTAPELLRLGKLFPGYKAEPSKQMHEFYKAIANETMKSSL